MDRHEYENRHNFDTFGGEGDESILKLQLKMPMRRSRN